MKQSLIRLGIIAAILVSLLFPSVALKQVYANPEGPDLVITKTAYPFEVIAGEFLIYHITVTNNGDPATNVVVTDWLPSGVSYVGDTDNGVPWYANAYNFTLGSIGAGKSKSFYIKVFVDPRYVRGHGHTIENYANVTCDQTDEDYTDNEVLYTSFVQEEADLKVTKFVKPDTKVLAGEYINYTIVVDNLGPSFASVVMLRDEILSSGTFTLLDIDSDRLTDIDAPPPGEYHDVTIECWLDPPLSILEPLGTYGPDSGYWTVWILLQANEALDINNDVIVYTATDYGTPDPDMSNNQAGQSISVTLPTADLKVTKFCKPETTVLAGEPINCTIIVENLGPATAYGVCVRDEIISSGEFELTGLYCDRPYLAWVQQLSEGHYILEFMTEPLEPKDIIPPDTAYGGRWIIQYTVYADETQDINNLVNVFTTTQFDAAPYYTVDPDLSNNEAQCSIHITAVADLELTKTDTPDPVYTDKPPFKLPTLLYNLTVTNNGPSTAVNVVIRDILPPGVTINSVTSTPQGSCNAGEPDNPAVPTTCTIGSLAPGESATMLINVTVRKLTDLTILHNDAIVFSDTYDPDNSNNIATTSTRAGPKALLLASSVGEAPIGSLYLSLAAIGLISLVSVISLVAATNIDKRLTIKHLIGFIKARRK